MTILNKISQLLQARPVLRNSDKKLLITVWHTEGLHLTEQQRQIFLDKCTPAETITRARRSLRDKFPESEEVQQERFKKFLAYKDNAQHAINVFNH